MTTTLINETFNRTLPTALSQPDPLPRVGTLEATDRRPSSPTDLGLLLLRVGPGATMIQAGLIKALDFNTTAAFMEDAGWRAPTFAAAMVTSAETLGGVGLLLGLLTPFAACAVTAAMIDA